MVDKEGSEEEEAEEREGELYAEKFLRVPHDIEEEEENPPKEYGDFAVVAPAANTFALT